MAHKSNPKAAEPHPEYQTHAGEALMSSAELSVATGHGPTVISELKATGVITPVGRGQWPIIKTMGAMYRRLRERQDPGLEDRNRKNKSEANTAELDYLKAASEVCLMTDAKQFWSDARIEIRQHIERATYLTPVQKTKLLADIAKMRTKQPEATE